MLYINYISVKLRKIDINGKKSVDINGLDLAELRVSIGRVLSFLNRFVIMRGLSVSFEDFHDGR